MARHQQIAVELGVEGDAVELDQSWSSTEAGPIHAKGRAARIGDFDGDAVHVVTVARLARLQDFNTPLARENGGIHRIHLFFEGRAQAAGQERRAERRRGALSPRALEALAAEDHRDPADPPGGNPARTVASGEGAEALGQLGVGAELLAELLGEEWQVDRRARGAGLREVHDLRRRLDRHPPLRLLGRGSQVRSQDHRIDRAQLGVGGERLDFCDIERGAGDLPRAQRRRERALVDDSATRRVHQSNPTFAFRERRFVEEVARRVDERAMQCQEIGVGEERVLVDERHAGDRRRVLREERIEGEDPHLQAERPVGHDPPDLAEADDSEGLPTDLGSQESRAVVFPRANVTIGLRHVPGQCQQ